jgi:hypothetical protein
MKCVAISNHGCSCSKIANSHLKNAPEASRGSVLTVGRLCASKFYWLAILFIRELNAITRLRVSFLTLRYYR